MEVARKFMSSSLGQSRKDISYYPLKIFWYTGLHPKHKSRFIRVLFFFNFLGLSMWLSLGAIGVKMSLDNGDLNYMVECLQTCILMVHCIGKQGAIMLNKTSLNYLIDYTSNFLLLDEFDSKTRETYQKILDISTLFINSCIIFGGIICLFFYIQPFITGTLPTVCYEPPGWHLFLIVSFWYLCFFMFGGIVGTNSYFWALCLPVIIQFKLLKNKYQSVCFKNKDEKQIWVELKKLINYHRFLLEYSNCINNMAKTVFLLECLISVITSCLGLFIIMHDEIPLGNKLKCGVYFMGEIIGTGIFCFSAELISDALHWGLELPEWTRNAFPEQLERMTVKQYEIYGGTTEMLKLASGYLLQKIVDDTRQKINGTMPKERTAFLYSGHEYKIQNSKSSEIANAIYSSSWYESDASSVRKAINMLIMRSQKAVTFTGHGFIVINATTFTMVFKSILSFYTYLKTMEERKMLNN